MAFALFAYPSINRAFCDLRVRQSRAINPREVKSQLNPGGDLLFVFLWSLRRDCAAELAYDAAGEGSYKFFSTN